MKRPLRTIVVGDALLPSRLIVEALAQLAPTIEIVRTLEWGPPDEALVDEMALRLERGGPEAENPPPQLAEHLQDADALVVHYCPVARSLLANSKGLKLLATCRAGTENLDLEAAAEMGLTTVHVIGRTTEAVSDFTLGLLLSEARNIARAHSRLMQGLWDKAFVNSSYTPELQGRTVGIVGFGEVGRAVTRKLGGFDVRILASDPYADDRTISQAGAQPSSLDDLLAASDFVTLHARPSPGAPPLIGTRELSLMKPTAFLVNTARAALVDPQALYEALSQRRIAGAALDVHDNEPLGPDHPFLSLENVTLTPHLASSTIDCMEKSPRLLVADLKRLLDGEVPRTVLEKGDLSALVRRRRG